ncbi:putative G-protein coupled receptor 141 [Neosynchiropus ocellatus]
MNSTTTAPTPHTTTVNQGEYNTVLITIYSVVLVCGAVSIALMFRIMKCRASSTTSITVIYLIVSHFIFLLTVPFRIYYYSSGQWIFGLVWCKIVSSLVHIHMYTCFVFYAIIIITRLKHYYQKSEIVTYHSKVLPLLIGAVVSVAVFIVIIIVIGFSYGNSKTSSDNNNNNSSSSSSSSGDGTRCFQFGTVIQISAEVKVLNYITCTLVIAVTVVLTALQVNVLRLLNPKNAQGCMQQLDYGIHQKSLLFAIIMLVCFVPYHIFRLHYLENLQLQNINEVFLSLTTFNCLDLLTILGGQSCKKCLP